MDINTPKPPAAPAPSVAATPAPIRHAEPKTGGSYTRNPVDGSLVKNPATATQLNQE
ncbi:hypothetical protein [Janthinobacterium sp. PAMC25594]|uniref:hypothetical protein n=1 Tax=Janthinobacterium sp. PAMC25594 TaxID=2861284 RepID=UPI001C62F962|nr:hypothetical protein [Janthinobacterium sp. PAMC25594]QYG07177.1 hypothetical protein KY494_29020 [Janthinobacterium sp. PAMC25594]